VISAAFARDVIAKAAPEGRERAKNLLRAAGKLAGYGIGLGLEPVPEVLLHPSAAGRFTRCAPGLTGVAQRTLRTNLRFIGRRVVPQLYPANVPLPRNRSRQPYGHAEIDGYLALADAQPTRERQMRAAGLVCLGAGAGLIRGDLRDVRGADVACRSGGVVVSVRQAERTFGLAAGALASDQPGGLPSGRLQRICDALLEASVQLRSGDRFGPGLCSPGSAVAATRPDPACVPARPGRLISGDLPDRRARRARSPGCG